MWGSVIEGLRVAFFSSMPFCVLKKIAQMVAVEHVLDLENAGNFDRHTSVLALSCNFWEAPSAKSDPGSSDENGSGERCSVLRARVDLILEDLLTGVR